MPPSVSYSLSKRLLLLIGFLSIFAFAFSLYSQHGLSMRPCAWCIFQRLLVLVGAILALIAILLAYAQRLGWSRLLIIAVFVLNLGGAWAAWHQYSIATHTFTCAQGFADKTIRAFNLDEILPAVFGIRATCMEARADLFGIEYVLWVLGLFAILAALSFAALAAFDLQPKNQQPKNSN